MWTKGKIEEYISQGIEENKHLEYKGAGAVGKSEEKKKEISKDISSFANSDGGIIIYGIKEFDDNLKRHLPEKIEPIDRTEFSKEWFENIITGNISPTINGLNIFPVVVDDATNFVVYVIEVKKSRTAHQAADNRYYKRHNFKAIPMEDWEVKDVINRANKPIIDIIIYGVKNPDLKHPENVYEYELLIVLKNNGNIGAQQIEVYVEFEKNLFAFIKKPKPVVIDKRIQVRFNNRKDNKIVIENREIITSSYFQPLLPQVFREIGTIEIKESFLKKDIKFLCHVATEFGTYKKEFNLQDIVKKLQ